jgi:hypothetical protein
MFTIRQEQMDVFEEDCDRQSSKILAPLFRLNWPLETDDLTDEELQIWIQARMAAGRSLGLVEPGPRAHLANLCCFLGDWFFEEPEFRWVQALLKDSSLPEQERLNRIYAGVRRL